MVDAYLWALDCPLVSDLFNISSQNITVAELAKGVAVRVGQDTMVTTVPSNDPRSYRLSADRLLSAGFKWGYSLEEGLDELVSGFAKGDLVDEDWNYNIRWMKKHGFK
jgi:nucleoside-diphosphate-sugar epimerase